MTSRVPFCVSSRTSPEDYLSELVKRAFKYSFKGYFPPRAAMRTSSWDMFVFSVVYVVVFACVTSRAPSGATSTNDDRDSVSGGSECNSRTSAVGGIEHVLQGSVKRDFKDSARGDFENNLKDSDLGVFVRAFKDPCMG